MVYHLMKRKFWLVSMWALLLGIYFLAGPLPDLVGQGQSGAKKRLLVVTVTKGFRHSSIPTAEKVLAELAQKNGWELEYVRDDKGDADDKELAEKTTAAALKKYDGVIFANTTGD